ncbi:uncharacterized protein LOC129598758 [Paramacrobiotus metropolitanus]|uniref:uncharacterized protein LOC129598758 n=1 Tax=Paramacrobiotus metropolitanus TaxID=2943436 RepID=UPI002445FADD|nr:uncharacterized protein LOC129598758 [Paramacrobiotus metropolitanus]
MQRNLIPKQTLRWELCILCITGFVPIAVLYPRAFTPKITNILDILSRIVGLLLITGSWICCSAVCFLIITRLGRTDWYFPTNNVIIQAAIASTVVLVNLRAAAVLTILYIKRDAWHEILAQFDRLTQSTTQPPSVRIFGAGTCLLLIMTAVVWSYTQISILIGRQISFYAADSFEPVPIVFIVYQFVIFWWIFNTGPLLLTQLLLGTQMTFAHFQNQTLQLILTWQNQLLSKLRSISPEKSVLLSADVAQMGNMHYETVALCERLNAAFSRALFFIYGLDCLTAFGNVATLVAGFAYEEQKLSPLYVRIPVVYAVMVFLSHATVCLIPMAQVEQTGQQIADGYYRLWGVVQLNRLGDVERPSAAEAPTLGEDFQRLGKISEKAVPVFYAGHVCRITWHFIAKTLTYMASFVILAYEIVDVSGVRDGLEKLHKIVQSHMSLSKDFFNYSAYDRKD